MIFVQKKGFLMRDFLAVGIIFSMVIALYVLATGAVAANYHNTEIVSQSFADHYSHLNDNLNKLDNTYNAVKGGNGGLNLIGTFNVAFNSVFTVAVMVWDSVKLFGSMGGNIASDFTFLDSNALTVLLRGTIAIILVYLILVWVSSVSRGKL